MTRDVTSTTQGRPFADFFVLLETPRTFALPRVPAQIPARCRFPRQYLPSASLMIKLPQSFSPTTSRRSIPTHRYASRISEIRYILLFLVVVCDRLKSHPKAAVRAALIEGIAELAIRRKRPLANGEFQEPTWELERKELAVPCPSLHLQPSARTDRY